MYSKPSWSKVLVLGGGQLGRMMILEGRSFPIEFGVVEEQGTPGCQVSDICFHWDQFREAVSWADVVTFEFENVDEKALLLAEEEGKLFPGIKAIKAKKDRREERKLLSSLGLPVPRWYPAEDGEEALRILKDQFNNVGVIKAARGGYDGKGQFYVNGSTVPELRESKEPYVVEEFVDFDYEASVIGVRGKEGQFVSYPESFNVNVKGILLYSFGPTGDERMTLYVERLAERLDYVGTLGVEFFVRGNEVLINEYAPRVHNTGHHTLDAARTSQFENHIRAILGLPLGETEVHSAYGTVNVLGLQEPPIDVLKYGKLYWYGKKEARKRRKMGHINVLGRDLGEVREKIDKVMSLLYPAGPDL